MKEGNDPGMSGTPNRKGGKGEQEAGKEGDTLTVLRGEMVVRFRVLIGKGEVGNVLKTGKWRGSVPEHT